MAVNGSIHKEERPGRPTRYRVRWRDQPGANPRSRSFVRQHEARQFLAALQSEQAPRDRTEGAGYDYLSTPQATVEQAVAEFLDAKRGAVAVATLDKYAALSKHLTRHHILRSQIMRHVKPGAIYDLLAQVADAGAATSTIQSLRSVL